MSKRDLYAAERSEPFTTNELQALTGVSLMSLYLWGRGSSVREPLNAKKLANGRKQYPVKATLRWLRRYGIEPVVHPDDLGKKARKAGPVRPKHAPERRAAYQ
jgi:hypothetical protein